MTRKTNQTVLTHGGDWAGFAAEYGAKAPLLDVSANVSPLGMPAGVAAALAAWMLVVLARCCLRDDFRMFRADRIAAVAATGISFRPRRAALLRAVRKGLVDDVFVTRLSQLSRKRSRLRRILVRFQRKGVCVHTTEIDLRYDLYRHGLDNVLTGGCGFHA